MIDVFLHVVPSTKNKNQYKLPWELIWYFVGAYLGFYKCSLWHDSNTAKDFVRVLALCQDNKNLNKLRWELIWYYVGAYFGF